MNKFLYSLEKKFGRYAVPNLTIVILGCFGLGYILEFMGYGNFIGLDPYAIIHGQIWRLVTWVMMPPGTSLLWAVIMFMLYYSLGSNLENSWGTFRYNVFILSGYLFTFIGAWLVWGIGLKLGFGFEGANAQVFGAIISNYVSTYYVCMSIFLAFAISNPEMKLLLYFIIPIKIKWLAILDVVMVIYDMYRGNWVSRIIIVMSLLNVVLYFLSTRDLYRIKPSEVKRKKDYARAMNEAQNRGFRVYEGGSSAIAKHKCALCGRTDISNPELEFRFCSQCNGNYEYCEDHIRNHTHVQ